MKRIITDKLAAIEQAHHIKLLYACESGSRGWEFPSPDSDYDVRFIYVRSMNEYLSVTSTEDNLTFPINDELDIYGWDIRKVLALVRKSNTTPFEWLQSPIVYREARGFKEDLWRLCQNYFSRRGNIHHYLGIAKGALDTANGCAIKIKKLFYVLRPLLAAKWCLEKDTIAPMAIGPLMELLPGDIKGMVSALIVQKRDAPEGFLIDMDPALKDWINTEFAAISEASKDLPRDVFEGAALDEFFRTTIMQHDHTGLKR